ncbi:hypothetical protein PtB15_14B59 [Puccinia triticina]|nr:hypothetical protein PtB15_14B59 [Puccinia triticina]
MAKQSKQVSSSDWRNWIGLKSRKVAVMQASLSQFITISASAQSQGTLKNSNST